MCTLSAVCASNQSAVTYLDRLVAVPKVGYVLCNFDRWFTLQWRL
jgi:hypothetical protein